jgi:hypothetical protein
MGTEIDSGRRFALIIANSKYQDPDLKELIAPGKDSESLADVLKDASIGNFNVQILLNEPAHRINEEIQEFFNNRNRSDVLLLYFSCHGIKDVDGYLYFAAINTRLNLLASTAVSANFVNERMRESRSRRQLLILDCCNSGAFAKGAVAKADKMIHAGGYFEGNGRIVLTASDSMQYSFEGDSVVGVGKSSVFTSALVKGLKTGKADTDRNGKVSYNELYNYIHDNVTDETTFQTPMMWAFGIEGELVVAKNPYLYEPMAHVKNKSVSNGSSYSKTKGTDMGTHSVKTERRRYITKLPLIFIILAAIAAVALFGVLYFLHPPSSMSKSITVNEDSQNIVMDLDSLFQNQQGLIYSISGNSNPSLVQPSINATTLILSFLPDQSGFADVSIKATDPLAKSKTFTVKVNVIPINDKPEIKITYPKNNSVLTEGSDMFFSAHSSDPEDGDISKSIKWTSSIDGELGQGPTISPSLSVGDHLITLAAKDKAGVVAQSDIHIKIIAK